MIAYSYNRENLREIDKWGLYRKKVITPMVRIDGPFKVVTREGEIACEDGWLALDSAGWPYPVAASEHVVMYEAI